MTRKTTCPTQSWNLWHVEQRIISTNVGGIPDMVTDNYNGKLIQRDGSRQMADAILHAMEDRKTLPKWSANARASAELNFLIKNKVQNILKSSIACLKKIHLRNLQKDFLRKAIKNSAKRIPALNFFPSKDYRQEALNWYKQYSGVEG